MSVRTPILTTSSEIWAFAAPPDTATARPAATAAASDFIVSSPRLLVEGFGYGPLLAFSGEAAKPTFRAYRRFPYNPGSLVMLTVIAPWATAMTRSVLESKA